MDNEPLHQPTPASSRFPDGFRIMHGKQEYITYVEHSSVRIWYSDVGSFYDAHTHSAVEIIMPQQGVSVYRLPGETYAVQAGEVLIVPPGCTHSLTEEEGIVRHLILFEPTPLMSLLDITSINQLLQQPIYLRDHSELHRQVRDLLSQAADCYMKREPMWNTQCYSYLLQMYVLLGQNYLKTAGMHHYSSRMSIDPEIMNSAITYINEHYMDDISLEQVAAFAGFSKYYFSRMFKQFASVSFTEYLTAQRMNVAVDLLGRTRKPIREIAEAAGFGSTATFNRVFREHKNCTPSQYRAIYGTAIPPRKGKPVF